MLIWVGMGRAEPRRLLKQRTDPFNRLDGSWDRGLEGGGAVEDAQGRAMDPWPKEPILQVHLG